MEFWILSGGVSEEVPSRGVLILDFFLIFWGSFGAIWSSSRKLNFWL